MAVEEIVKGSLDWHIPVNQNFRELEEKERQLDQKKLDKPSNPKAEGMLFQNADGSTSVIPVDTAEDMYVYGFTYDSENPDPKVEYTDGAVGKVAAVNYQMNSWRDTKLYRDIKPCLTTNSGVVQVYLQKDDFRYTEEGGFSQIDPNSGDPPSGRQIMIEFPKLYWDFQKVGSIVYVRLGNYKFSDTAVCYAFRDGEMERDHLYISSQFYYPGNNMETTQNTIRSSFGSRAHCMSFYAWTLLQILAVLFYKTRDLQTALGKGMVNWRPATSSQAAPSTCLTSNGDLMKMPFCYGYGGWSITGYDSSRFKDNDGLHGMKFLGLNHFYGEKSTLLDGIRYYQNQFYLTLYTSRYGADLSEYEFHLLLEKPSSQYIRKTACVNEFGFIPIPDQNSTYSTYYCDYYRQYPYSNKNDTSIRLIAVGTSATNAIQCGTEAGLFFLDAYYNQTTSFYSSNCYYRLMYL